PVIAAHHVEFRHFGKAELQVGARIVQGSGIEQAAIHDRHDLATGKNGDLRAELLENIGGKPVGAKFQPLEIVAALDLFSEPAKRLGRHREVDQADQIEL